MFIEYDTEHQILYLRIRDGKVAKTEEYRAEVFVDLDKKGHLLGIELLNLEDSKYIPQIAREYSLSGIKRLHPEYLKKVLA